MGGGVSKKRLKYSGGAESVSSEPEDQCAANEHILQRASISDKVIQHKFSKSPQIGKLFREFIKSERPEEIDGFLSSLLTETEEEVKRTFLRETYEEMKRLLKVNTMAQELSKIEDRKDQFSFIMRSICDICQADRAVLYLCDYKHHVLRVQVVRQQGLQQKSDAFSAVIPMSEGICGEVARTGVSINVKNAQNDDRFHPLLDETTNYETKSILTVPIGFVPYFKMSSTHEDEDESDRGFSFLESGDLIDPEDGASHDAIENNRGAFEMKGNSFAGLTGVRESESELSEDRISSNSNMARTTAPSLPKTIGEIPSMDEFVIRGEAIGVIQVMNRQGKVQEFTEDDLALLESVAHVLTGFMKHSTISDRERVQRMRKESILKLAVALGRTKDVRNLIETIASTLQETFHVERCSLFFVDHQNNELWTVASLVGDWKAITKEDIVRLPMGKGFVGEVAVTGELLNIQNAYADPRFNSEVDRLTNFRSRSILCGPIKDSRGKVVAVIELINKKSNLVTNFQSHKLNHPLPTDQNNADGSHYDLIQGKRTIRGATSSSNRSSMRGSITYGKGENLQEAFDEDDEELLQGMFSILSLAIANTELISKAYIMQNRLRSVLENVSELVLTVDKNGCLTGFNRSSSQISALFGEKLDLEALLRDQITFTSWFPDRRIAENVHKLLNKANELANDGQINEVEHLKIIKADHHLENASIVNYSIKALVGFGNEIYKLDLDNETKEEMKHNSVSSNNIQKQGSMNLLRGNSVIKSSFEQPKTSSKSGSVMRFHIPRDESLRYFDREEEEHRKSIELIHNGNSREVLGAVICIDDQTHEQKLMKTLNKYMSPDLVSHLLMDGKLRLGGKKQQVTILFSDIRGFTTFSETSEATDVFTTLNEYFSCMVDVVTQHGGMVDKFIGDALMAVFGVPNPKPEDARNACLAARAMEIELEKFNEERKRANKDIIKIGIGICTGEVCCGNIGSENRFEYTVIGDAVNVASRLESTTKEYGVVNLISESTYNQMIEKKDDFPVHVVNEMDLDDLESLESDKEFMLLREVDIVRVAGKDDVTKLFQILGSGSKIAHVLSPNDVDTLKSYTLGLQAYRNREIKQAYEYFEAAGDKDDGPSILFEDRCEHLLANPPGAQWDGVWDMQKVSVWTYNERTNKSTTSNDNENETGDQFDVANLPDHRNSVARSSVDGETGRRGRSRSIIIKPQGSFHKLV